MNLYLIGSLRNPAIPSIANALRAEGFTCFDDWFAAGPDADDCWREYEIKRGHTYQEALEGLAARHVFDFDFAHMVQADAAVLATPAGKSGHLELGYFLGQGKPGHILLNDDPDRFDVMYRFATGVHKHIASLVAGLKGDIERIPLKFIECARCRVRGATQANLLDPLGQLCDTCKGPPLEIEGERWHYGR